jgi:hypothetical protein
MIFEIGIDEMIKRQKSQRQKVKDAQCNLILVNIRSILDVLKVDLYLKINIQYSIFKIHIHTSRIISLTLWPFNPKGNLGSDEY